MLVEDGDGDGGAIAAGAVDGEGAVAGDFGDAFLQVVERNVDAVGDVFGLMFAGGTDIDDEGGIVGFEGFGHHLGVDAEGGPDKVLAMGEGGHAVLQVAHDVIEADAAEAGGGFLFAAGLGDDDDRLRAIEDGAGPGGVLASEADVDAAGEVSFGVLGWVANIEDLDAGIAMGDYLIEFDGMERAVEHVFESGALAGIEDRVVGEIGRGVGLVSGDDGDELILRHGLERVVEKALLAQGGEGVGGELLAAEGAGAVGRIHEGRVGQGQELVVEGIVEVGAEVVGGPAEGGAEVGAADIADEESVAGEDGIGICGVFRFVKDEQRDGFDGVAGGLEDLDAEAGKVDGVAVVHGDEGVFGLGAGAEVDGSVAAVTEFEVAGEEIGVEVSEEDVLDLSAELGGLIEVLLDVALGIDDDGGLRSFIGD